MSSNETPRDSYHHGNLPQTLIAEGAKLLAERGADGFSLREVARRAGVAVAAPSHHFGNAKGLLTAIATDGFKALAGELSAAKASATTAEAQLTAMCRAYAAIGRTAPGHASIMFQLDLLDQDDPAFRHEAIGAFDLFKEVLAQAASDTADPDMVSQAAKLLWAATHGIVTLKMIPPDEAETLITFAVQASLARLL